jgi:hypothetical protein
MAFVKFAKEGVVMDFLEKTKRFAAKTKAKRRAQNEGGHWEDYIDDELAKKEEANPSTDNPLGQEVRQSGGGILGGLGELLRETIGNVTYTPEPPIDLNVLSVAELEELQEKTQLEIQDLEERLQKWQEMAKFQTSNDQPPPQIAEVAFGPTPEVIRQRRLAKQKLLVEIKSKLKHKQIVAPQLSEGEQLAAELRANEEEKQKVLATVSEVMKPQIEKLYRQKQDEILEKFRK